MTIQTLTAEYRGIVNGYVRYLWGGPMSVALGVMYDTSDLPGFVAVDDGVLLGAALYRPDGDECEVASLFSLIQNRGAGTALLNEIIATARREGRKRVWLITTNDDTQAIRFYQRYGFALKAVHIGAFQETRRLKGGLPELGIDRIPIEHEFEFEILL